ncbi:unnamed protein product [marine sediment metagenome]|uniref:Uncharacterized protein n=1 Tax=marine sediment metagenome TaxID=412755 RepID=X0UCS9_9ZZZZ
MARAILFKSKGLPSAFRATIAVSKDTGLPKGVKPRYSVLGGSVNRRIKTRTFKTKLQAIKFARKKIKEF